jgi:hypothetical protein
MHEFEKNGLDNFEINHSIVYQKINLLGNK